MLLIYMASAAHFGICLILNTGAAYNLCHRYAAGASIQVLLFGVLAIEVKIKAPQAHTFLEIILARWGYTAHKVFLGFALLTNMLVTAMLLLGGSATVSAITGMDVNLASFLIPFGIIACTCMSDCPLLSLINHHYVQILRLEA